MDIDKLFNGLESNQLHEYEESKQKLVELLINSKDHALVQLILNYFLKTRSVRVIEVLYKAQEPQNIYILDRLDEWLKTQTYQLQALSILCALIRLNATWLNYAIKDHKLLKSIFKLIMTEREVVAIMSALLCVILLLPIVTTGVPSYLNDLFEVFAHLASWKIQHTRQLTDDKLVHLQLGLQMLFHRLYGMYPCTFMQFLADFSKRDKGGVWQHTIKPLLNTVRIHPMLLIDTAETELIGNRWSAKQPHDIESECAQTSLPVIHPDFKNEYSSINLPGTPVSLQGGDNSNRSRIGSTASNEFFAEQLKKLQETKGSIVRSSADEFTIWEPDTELTPLQTNVPLTPVASYASPSAVPGTSPPEAAVEATPESTPLKDATIAKPRCENPAAMRAIFTFPNNGDDPQLLLKSKATPAASTNEFSLGKRTIGTRIPSVYDRRIQQVMLDRAEFVESELQPEDDNCDLEKEPKAQVYSIRKTPTKLTDLSSELRSSPRSALTQSLQPASAFTSRSCDNCNETEREMCSEGGLHMPTKSAMQNLFKATKRRQRMDTYCCNNSAFEKASPILIRAGVDIKQDAGKSSLCGRRCRSCPSLPTLSPGAAELYSTSTSNAQSGIHCHKVHPLQKCDKMLAIVEVSGAKAGERPDVCSNGMTRGTQTLEPFGQLYENLLFELLSESTTLRRNYEQSLIYPQEILDQYILHMLQDKENFDAENMKLICLQLQYERYRRGIHAERNRRLLGRCRDRRTLEMERDILREQLNSSERKNNDLLNQLRLQKILLAERAQSVDADLESVQAKYLAEVEKNTSLVELNGELERRLNEESAQRKASSYELGCLKGQLFDLTSELEQSHKKIERGVQCRQELAQLEAEFITMAELQAKCRGRLRDVDNQESRDAEMQSIQNSYLTELKELKQNLADKTAELESIKEQFSDLNSQLSVNECVIAEQNRALYDLREEHAERFKALNKKYETQKLIILQLEEQYTLHFRKTQGAASPDTDRTDVASSAEHNSSLSVSLASSDGLSASLRSGEFKGFHQLLETPPTLNDIMEHPGSSSRATQQPSSSNSSDFYLPDTSTSKRN